jgi:heme exporter protein B
MAWGWTDSTMRTALRHIFIILWKDLLIDLRRKENILAMVFFSLLTLLIFQFALGGSQAVHYRLTPRAMTALDADGAAPETLRAVASLTGVTHATRASLLAALDALGPHRPLGEARISILKAARRTSLQASAAGLLWVMFLLAGLLGLSKSFSQEKENGCMEGLLLTPAGRGVLYLGKMGSNVLFLLLLLAIVLPLFALLYQIPLTGVLLPLCGVLLAGVLGFSALGTLLGAMTSTLRGREVLLPLLLFPLLAPIVIVVVHLTGIILEGESLAEQMDWIRLLAAIDAVFLIVSYLVFEYVMEA